MYVFQLTSIPHNEYPPLIPLSIAFFYNIFGYSTLVTVFFHSLIYTLIIITLGYSLSIVHAAIGCSALLLYATTQYADLSVGFCITIAVLLYLHKRNQLLIGLLLGFAALIKNEGLVVIPIFLFVATIFEKRLPVWIFAGTLPPLIAVVIFKSFVTIEPNDIISSSNTINRLFDASRYFYVSLYFLPNLISWAYFAVPTTILLALTRKKRIYTFPLYISGLMLLAYFIIYIITPHDLDWHLTTSFDRLIAQIFPVFLLTFTNYAIETVRFAAEPLNVT